MSQVVYRTQHLINLNRIHRRTCNMRRFLASMERPADYRTVDRVRHLAARQVEYSLGWLEDFRSVGDREQIRLAERIHQQTISECMLTLSASADLVAYH